MGAFALMPAPLSATNKGLFWFAALCVMERTAEAVPAIVGENCIVTVTDWPGAKLNAPPPLTTENGAERVPTSPVNAVFELAWFVIVMFWFEDCPTVTFPKFIEVVIYCDVYDVTPGPA